MKRMHRIAVLVMTVCLVLGTMTLSVFADYDHQLTVSPGNGSFESGSDVLIGDTITLTTGLDADVNGEKVTPPDENHFVTGVKIAGLDNASTTIGPITKGDKDVDYVVAYGLKSNMVEYTVNYVDLNAGGAVMDSETHYGVIGDKPVVSYKYFEGYTPSNAYALTKKLTNDPANNIFDFEYLQVDNEGNVITVLIGGGGATGAGGGGAGAGCGFSVPGFWPA